MDERIARLHNVWAILICKNNGQPITQKELGNIVCLGTKALFRYAKVKTLIVQAVREDKQERQERYFQERREEKIQ